MDAIIITCKLNHQICHLKLSLHKLSAANTYHLYKQNKWVGIIRRTADQNKYTLLSYATSFTTQEVEMIGKQIDRATMARVTNLSQHHATGAVA